MEDSASHSLRAWVMPPMRSAAWVDILNNSAIAISFTDDASGSVNAHALPTFSRGESIYFVEDGREELRGKKGQR
jgi:hypothetical protein